MVGFIKFNLFEKTIHAWSISLKSLIINLSNTTIDGCLLEIKLKYHFIKSTSMVGYLKKINKKFKKSFFTLN